VVVSEDWRTRLHAEYGLTATVVHNGVDAGRFPPLGRARREAVRRELGLSDRFTFLAVGGIEPRKGSVVLFRAMAILARQIHPTPALVVVGGHSFQDYGSYRDEALAMLPELGLEVGRDVILAGTVSDAALHEYYRSADALAFPSVKEGWGLVVLEAMTADLPVVASDIPVLHEYLTDHETAVLTHAGDPQSLADGLFEVVTDGALRERLIEGGRSLVPRFSWERAALEHRTLYAGIWAMRGHAGPAAHSSHAGSGT
jgi:glycosyltransferase involved in cell wall biosynthesis